MNTQTSTKHFDFYVNIHGGAPSFLQVLPLSDAGVHRYGKMDSEDFTRDNMSRLIRTLRRQGYSVTTNPKNISQGNYLYCYRGN